MNFYLLNLLGKWLSLGILGIASLTGLEINNKEIGYANNHNKNTTVVTNTINYKTKRKYSSKLPVGINKTLVEGKNGIIFMDDSKEIVLEEVIDEEILIGTGRNGKHTGVMTGYGPDCSTCSGVGTVACRTKDRKNFNLINDDIYYDDEEYGKARVLAADLSYFPCGTIIEVVSPNLGTFTGIVMDTGYTMREKFKQGIFHFDVAYKTEKDENIRFATNMSGKVEFNVQRWGW